MLRPTLTLDRSTLNMTNSTKDSTPFGPGRIQLYMRKRTSADEAQFQRLRKAYDAAFQNWTRQVRLLESLTSGSVQDSSAIEEARRQVEQAQIAYRESRNLLAEFIMAGAAPTPTESGAESHLDQKSQVERLAYGLWEEAGRPDDSADTDWQRAEQRVLSKSE